MARPRLLLSHISEGMAASFVRKDFEMLRESFDVTAFYYRGYQSIPGLARSVAASDIILSWFAWDHAFWGNHAAKVLGRGSVTIAGGFDVVSLPEIGYGGLLGAKSRRRIRDALRSAGVTLAVSRSVADDAASVSGRKDIRVAYLGFDEAQYPPPVDKKRAVMTVGAITESNLLRKGIRTFARAASHLPDVPFLIAGLVHEKALEELRPIPSNLKVLGYLSDADLLRLMRETKVYVQVSAHEGFGSALAEAMLCGAVPVVTKRGALPEVVGDTGIYVEYDDPEGTSGAIREALTVGRSSGRAARERIVTQFPLEKRREALIDAVSEVLP